MVSFYRTFLKDLSGSITDRIVETLTTRQVAWGYHSVRPQQSYAWRTEIEILKEVGTELIGRNPESANWALLLEYPIPLRGKRIDAVLLGCHVVFVLEFKVGSARYELADQVQAAYYALDLFDFHEATRDRPVVPILVATRAPANEPPARPDLLSSRSAYQSVEDVLRENVTSLAESIRSAHDRIDGKVHGTVPPIEAAAWDDSRFNPSPGILEAARELCSRHSVEEIRQAFGQRLEDATGALRETVLRAKQERKRIACFVSGVPGSGKTLVGLNAVLDKTLDLEGGQAVLLSGNRPLVRILQEALVRDAKDSGRAPTRAAAERLVKTPVRGVLEFVRSYAKTNRDGRSPSSVTLPVQRLIIFDEAQRAWSRNGMEKKQGINQSEAAVLLEIAARQDWGVVVALIGGGQEIHNEEAGLRAWSDALDTPDSPWEIVASPAILAGGATTAGEVIRTSNRDPGTVQVDSRMELATSTRAVRSRFLTRWVDALLAGSPEDASELIGADRGFPVALTRDLADARAWLRSQTATDQRCGLVASSGAVRLRAHGLEASSPFRRGFPFAEWFLADATDVRSSNSLEVSASEFECQGLELDWVGVCWGDDFTWDDAKNQWRPREFRGTKWGRIRAAGKRDYLLNKYRVLLTRARSGMILWVPPGDPADSTRNPHFLDSTASLLDRAGIPLWKPP